MKGGYKMSRYSKLLATIIAESGLTAKEIVTKWEMELIRRV